MDLIKVINFMERRNKKEQKKKNFYFSVSCLSYIPTLDAVVDNAPSILFISNSQSTSNKKRGIMKNMNENEKIVFNTLIKCTRALSNNS